MAQEWFFKEGNRGLYSRCSIASFENKFGHVQIDMTSETPLCRLCGESTETVSHIVSG